MGGKVNFLIILALLGVSQVASQTASCQYGFFGDEYICRLTIQNPQGWNNFTEVTGQHLEGKTDEDVLIVSRFGGATANIPTIFCTQFPNLRILDLFWSNVSNVAEDSIAACQNLQILSLFDNLITQLPEAFFVNNQNLTIVDLVFNRLTTLPENIFAPLVNLQTLGLRGNPFEFIPGGLFRTLQNLHTLGLEQTRISQTNPEWFSPLINLQSFNIGGNLFTSINRDTFANVTSSLLSLTFSNNNQLQNISFDAFRGFPSLISLSLQSNNLREIDPEWFASMPDLRFLSLSFNHITEIPEGAFVNNSRLMSFAMWNNQLRYVRRNQFGDLSNLDFLDFEGNQIYAMDRSIFTDSSPALRTLHFRNNLCASFETWNFNGNFNQSMQALDTCFRNAVEVYETTTEGGEEYRFYGFSNPGISFSVMARERVHISLNPVEFEALPRVEIWLGENNNTRSMIRINGAENVVDISTPGILNSDSWTEFRIIYANWIALVYRGQEDFPFMTFNMRDFYPIHFYGIRSPGNVVDWRLAPLNLSQSPAAVTMINDEKYMRKIEDDTAKPLVDFHSF